MHKTVVKIIIWTVMSFPVGLMAQAPSKLGTTLEFKKQLKLSAEQVFQLTTRISSLNTFKTVLNADTDKFINDQLIKILDSEQYQSYVVLFRQIEVSYWTKIDWQQLKNFGLTKSLDSVKVNSQIFAYEMNKAIALERINNSKDVFYKGLLRDSVWASIPLILLKLDAYRNTLPKWSQTAKVIEFRKEINLTEIQLDSLLNMFTKLKIIKLGYKARHENVNGRKIESEGFLKVLSAAQIDKYLIVMSHDQAIKKAQTDWQNLKKYGLSKDLDSVKINNEIQAYEVKWLIAKERLEIDHSQKNAFNKKDIEDKGPKILKQLDIMMNTERVNNDIKSSMSW